MTKELSPTRWAIDISRILNTVFGGERFPIDVAAVAQEISQRKYPEEPIGLVAGQALHDFDGALLRDPAGKKGWAIIYNTAISSRGRINFTLAHEFGHYLIHRAAHPEGFSCSQQDMVRWDSDYRQLERQANEFAANLLMPLDDYRRQIDPKSSVTLAEISKCADRYEVSQIAATLRWLSYTQRRSVLVVSRDGFILWARSSDRALKTGAFFRTSRGVVPVPKLSLAASASLTADASCARQMGLGTWFANEACTETTILSERYDFALSLLQLPEEPPWANTSDADAEPEREEDLSDRISRIHGLD